MATVPQPEGRKLVTVSLLDVPLGKRLRAADYLLAREDNPLMRVEILTAAHRPSATRYLIPLDAWERVMNPGNGKP